MLRSPRSTPLSLHDALPICPRAVAKHSSQAALRTLNSALTLHFHVLDHLIDQLIVHRLVGRSEEHTSELQSQSNLVCRLLLEKKNDHILHYHATIISTHAIA